jgi:carboxypeptidase PM20D1
MNEQEYGKSTNEHLGKSNMKQKTKFNLKRILLVLLIAFLLLIGVLTWNYLTFSSRQLNVDSVSLQKVDTASLQERGSERMMLETFSRAIQIGSISTPMSRIAHDSTLYRFREFIQEAFPSLHQSPFVCRTGKDFGDERNPSILFQWPGQEPELGAILLMSHFDVVPVEASSLSKWTHPPFSGHMDDEFIWGRGTLDCKHGVMAILEAISKLSAEGFQPKRTIYVALGHDEEIGGADGNSKMAAWFRSHRIRLQDRKSVV